MEQWKLDRINALAKISKTRTLSTEEKKEQDLLRREYIDLFKENLRSTLEMMRDKP